MRSLILLLSAAVLLPAQSPQVQAALAAGSYFPLEIGNRWVYRIDSRTVSGIYQTWRVDRTEEREGKTYFVMAISSRGTLLTETFFRVDDRGRIFVLTGTGEQLFLDAADSSQSAQLRVQSRGGTFRNAIGSFSDTLAYQNSVSTLVLESGTLGRGIGLLSSTSTLIAGSSGGFSEGRTLVEAVIGGRLQFALASSGLQLGLESLTLDLTGKQAENCAIPCYFVACFLVPFTDPPGTYKPCTRVRVALSNWPAGASRSVRLQMAGPDGNVVLDQTVAVEAGAGDTSAFAQLRLYSESAEPYPPGAYRLTATTEDGAAQSSLALQIK